MKPHYAQQKTIRFAIYRTKRFIEYLEKAQPDPASETPIAMQRKVLNGELAEQKRILRKLKQAVWNAKQ